MGRLDFFARCVVLSFIQFSLNFIYELILKNIYLTDPNNSFLVLTLSVFEIVTTILVIIALFNITVRRWHDLGNSAWWIILNLIPLLNIFVSIYLVFKKGNPNLNKYGPPTK